MKQQQRRQLLIEPSFQIKFILKFCMAVVITSLLIGGSVYVLTRGSTTVAIENTKVFVKPTADFILPVLAVTVLLVSVFSALGVFILTLIISHRIAGPLFRLQKETECMQQGDLRQTFRIREKDQFQALSQSLFAMANTFRSRHTTLQAACQDLTQYLEKRNFCISSENKEELRKVLGKMKDDLNYFKVS